MALDSAGLHSTNYKSYMAVSGRQLMTSSQGSAPATWNKARARNERYTPASAILEAVRHVTGGMIVLDPASSAQANETVQASRFDYPTLEDDRRPAWSQDWEAESLWLNPAYRSHLARSRLSSKSW